MKSHVHKQNNSDGISKTRTDIDADLTFSARNLVTTYVLKTLISCIDFAICFGISKSSYERKILLLYYFNVC